MKHSLLFLFLLASSICLSAQTRPELNYFYVSDNIAKPVTVKTQTGSFKVYTEYTYRGHISRIEAFDAHGNRIVNTQPKKKHISLDSDRNSPNEYWYVFDSIYEDSNSYDNSGANQAQVYNSANTNNGNQTGTWNHPYEYNPYRDMLYERASNLQARLGTGLLGESFELRGELGVHAVGFTAFAGIQKDLIFFKNENTTFIDGFNAGLGCYFGGLKNTFALNLQFGEQFRIGDYFVVGLQYSHFFNKRIGAFLDCNFGGKGAGYKNFLATVQGGVAFKILTK